MHLRYRASSTRSVLVCAGLGLTHEEAPQFGGDTKQLKDKFTAIFKSKTLAEWREIFDDADACVMPVLDMADAPAHEHARFHSSFLPTPSGGEVPRPAPRLDRTPAVSEVKPDPSIGEHSREILREFGYSDEETRHLLENHVVHQSGKAKL